ncbi:MAG: sulfatase-like hydrolase/transferase [Bacteroidetes bacterium]|nr:sulfatase-like hydrolase/transferase [Bacteroidota bacterium]
MTNKLSFLSAFLWLVSICNLNAQEQPNIILIMADDLGFGDLSINGSTQIKTPFIDQLGKSGVICSEGYVSAPVCSPSRAGIMTGRNQVAFGHDNNIGGNQPGFDPAFLGMPLTETTIAERMKALGYVTGIVGKWHLGERPKYHPGKRGFDEYWTYKKGSHDYFIADSKAKGIKEAIDCNYKKVHSITYITDDKGDESVDFIERHKEEAFFLFVSFNAPHTPMQAKEEDLKLYAHIKNEKRRTYAAMVHSLDENVGKIIKKVKKAGLKKKTLIVFLSDNGGPVFSNQSNNAPYNGMKGILLEGGIHVPFIVSWPGQLKKGTIYDKPIVATDLAPTFLELGGGKISTADFDGKGVNLIPYLKNERTDNPHEQLSWRFTISAAIREGHWKLVRIPDRLPMLYDLSKDISEQNNLALKRLEITERLLKTLGEWDVNLPHPVFLEGAEWKARQLDLYDRKYQLVQPE